MSGDSQEEVARDLGLTDNALRQLVHRARMSMRAAATALTPMPLVTAAASGSARGGSLVERVSELVAGGGASVTLAKAGTVAVLAGSAISGPGDRRPPGTPPCRRRPGRRGGRDQATARGTGARHGRSRVPRRRRSCPRRPRATVEHPGSVRATTAQTGSRRRAEPRTARGAPSATTPSPAHAGPPAPATTSRATATPARPVRATSGPAARTTRARAPPGPRTTTPATTARPGPRAGRDARAHGDPGGRVGPPRLRLVRRRRRSRAEHDAGARRGLTVTRTRSGVSHQRTTPDLQGERP